MKILPTTAIAVLVSGAWSFAQDEAKPALTQEQTAFFESKIRPVFAEYCYKCHSSEEKVKGFARPSLISGPGS